MTALKFFTLLFGISLIAANSDYPDPIDECPDVQSPENFNANSFFKGRWNVLKLYGWLPKGNNSCTRIEFLQHENANEVEMNYFSYNNKNVVNNTYTWNITKSGEISYEGQHDYQTDKGGKSQNYHAKLTIVEYEENFAILIGCATNVYVKGKLCNDLSIISRGLILKPEYLTKAQAIIEKYNLNIAPKDIRQENCD